MYESEVMEGKESSKFLWKKKEKNKKNLEKKEEFGFCAEFSYDVLLLCLQNTLMTIDSKNFKYHYNKNDFRQH